MKFVEAKQRLKELAKGRFHSLQHLLAEHDNGRLEESFFMYVDPGISTIGDSWEQCLKVLEPKLNPEIKPPLEGMPE